MEDAPEYRELEPVQYEPDIAFTGARLAKLIRNRAYEFFEARGRQPGHELDDWLMAEQEVKNHFGL
jgi:hypothetical protein